jgi:hypothetical protein
MQVILDALLAGYLIVVMLVFLLVYVYGSFNWLVLQFYCLGDNI